MTDTQRTASYMACRTAASARGAVEPSSSRSPTRFAKSLLANLFGHTVHVLGQVFLVPVFLSCWDVSLYGEWITLSATVVYLGLVEMGLQMYVVNRLTQLWATGKTEQYTRTLHTALAAALCVALLGGGLALFAGLSLPLADWLSLQVIEASQVSWLVPCLACRIILAIPERVLTGVYRTMGDYPRGKTIENVERLLFFLVTAGAVSLGAGPTQLVAVQLLPMLFTCAFVTRDIARRYPAVDLGLRRVQTSLLGEFLKPSLLFFAIQVAAGLSVQGSTLLVQTAFGAATVVLFSTSRTLVNLIQQVTGAANAALWPELTESDAKGRRYAVRNATSVMTRCLLTLSFAAAAYLYWLGADVVAWWTRDRVTFSGPLVLALLVATGLGVAINCWSIVLPATNRHTPLAIGTFLGACLGLLSAFWLTQPLGVVGVPLGLFVGELVGRAWIVVPAARYLERRPLEMLGSDLGRALLGGLPVVAGALLVRWVAATFSPFQRQLLALPLLASLTLLGTLFGTLARSERDKLKNWIASGLRANKRLATLAGRE